MRPAGRASASWSLFVLSLLFSLVFAGDNEPKLTVQAFEHPPLNINYFEDSDIVMFHDVAERNIYRSEDAGASWTKETGIPDRAVAFFVMHPFERKTAFAMSLTAKHYKTVDQGKTWKEFSSNSVPSDFQPETLSFHADDPDRIIFNGMKCRGIFCDEEAMYTLDGFKSVKPLRTNTAGCRWAKSSKDFATGDAEKDKSRILCASLDKVSFFKEDQRLVISDSFFATEKGEVQEFEPNLDRNRAVDGIVNLAVVKKYILVAASSFGSDEMALYVTSDTVHWHRAVFPSDDSHDHSHQIHQGAYTVLESTPYSVQIDVMTSSHPSNPVGVLFTSNSNGTYLTENIPFTNRNSKGLVDFEKISGIQGIFLVNTVKNGKEVEERPSKEKVITTQITFDDGRTFDSIKAGSDLIHLHSITQLDNVGRVFSSPAPGIVLGNGNTGDSLGSFASSNLYVSSDAGVSWEKALDGPHKYEFGDSGSILVAIKDSVKEDIDSVSYSLDYGKKWDSVKLPDGLKIKPDILTTTQDSTSLKFLLLGESQRSFHMISIDFDGLSRRKCEGKDMEDWFARVDAEGKPTCLMGHKQSYSRRKQSAECFLRNDFKDPEPKTEDCECSDADFECDFNFQRDSEDNKSCKPVGPIQIPKGECRDKNGKFKGSSGWRLIPGNTCKRTSGSQKDDPMERDCSEGGTGAPGDGDGDKGKDGDNKNPPSNPSDGKVHHTKVEFETDLKDFQKFYLERGEHSSGTDETVIVRPVRYLDNDQIEMQDLFWRTTDHGKTWTRILEKESVKTVFAHDYFKDIVYFIAGEDNKVIYTMDRAQTFHSFTAPSTAKSANALGFHPNNKDWLIWVGEKCDEVGGSKSCYSEASISTDRGDNWKTALRYVVKCEFTGHSAYKFRSEKQVVCLAHKEENEESPTTIVTSDDFFAEKKVYGDEITNMATMSEFILATHHEKDTGLKALVSLDGKTFAPAVFPPKFPDDHREVYTVLDSSGHAINLFVATNGDSDRRVGSVLKSNSNGTSYVVTAPNINSNRQAYVDFEKVGGLEGVVVINVVTNPDEKGDKKLQTKMTHNDGAEWGYLAPPSKDAEGKSFECSSSTGDSNCALHIHHYTERDDKRRTFAAATAVGMVFAIGNVGPQLGEYKKGDTFLSTDGGVSWRCVKKGQWTWQYGDQGSIIVLAQRETHGNGAKTKMVSYSTDEGRTWTDYDFADEEVTVLDLTTAQGGSSRNFLLWCKDGKDKLFTVNLDFSGLADKPCKYMEGEEGAASDYYLWSPKHPLQKDDCMFGHVARYLRKKTDRQCYNEQSLKRLYDYETCACSRRDFECAWNYELDSHGQCHLVDGEQALSGQEWCKQHPNDTSWFEPTGYRRVPLSTCAGGQELDKTSTEHACAGYEEEFEKKHRTSGWTILFIVVVTMGLAGAAGWYVWRNWNGKFGQIRLGDNSSTFDSDQPWIKYPVMGVSAVVAVVSAMPLVLTSVWRTGAGVYERVRGGGQGSQAWPRRYTTADSFARGRGDYASVYDDEEGLFGEDSDDA